MPLVNKNFEFCYCFVAITSRVHGTNQTWVKYISIVLFKYKYKILVESSIKIQIQIYTPKILNTTKYKYSTQVCTQLVSVTKTVSNFGVLLFGCIWRSFN